jgi:hypothetical protein
MSQRTMTLGSMEKPQSAPRRKIVPAGRSNSSTFQFLKTRASLLLLVLAQPDMRVLVGPVYPVPLHVLAQDVGEPRVVHVIHGRPAPNRRRRRPSRTHRPGPVARFGFQLNQSLLNHPGGSSGGGCQARWREALRLLDPRPRKALESDLIDSAVWFCKPSKMMTPPAWAGCACPAPRSTMADVQWSLIDVSSSRLTENRSDFCTSRRQTVVCFVRRCTPQPRARQRIGTSPIPFHPLQPLYRAGLPAAARRLARS